MMAIGKELNGKNLAATLSLPPPKIYTSFKTLHYPWTPSR
jgi:hypothetical protein